MVFNEFKQGVSGGESLAAACRLRRGIRAGSEAELCLTPRALASARTKFATIGSSCCHPRFIGQPSHARALDFSGGSPPQRLGIAAAIPLPPDERSRVLPLASLAESGPSPGSRLPHAQTRGAPRLAGSHSLARASGRAAWLRPNACPGFLPNHSTAVTSRSS